MAEIWHKFLCHVQLLKREMKKMLLLSHFIEKALIENTSKSRNIPENRRRKLRKAMVFLQTGMYLNNTEKLKDNVTFNFFSIDTLPEITG